MGNLEAAIDSAIDEMPDEFVTKRFLLQNKAEANGMFLTEYDSGKSIGAGTARRHKRKPQTGSNGIC